MKLTKILITGVLSVAMVFASCSSDKNDDLAEVNSLDDQEHLANVDRSFNEESPAELIIEDHKIHETSPEVEREEVKLTLLPPAITETLKGKEYLDCKVERAFLIKENDTKTYEINVKKGEGQATFLFNDKGVRVDKNDK